MFVTSPLPSLWNFISLPFVNITWIWNENSIPNCKIKRGVQKADTLQLFLCLRRERRNIPSFSIPLSSFSLIAPSDSPPLSHAVPPSLPTPLIIPFSFRVYIKSYLLFLLYTYIYIYTLSTLALATIVGSLNIQDYPCMFSFFHSGLQSKHHKENFGSRHAFCTYCHVLLIPIFSFLTLQLLLTLHLFFYIRYSICVFFFIFWSCSTIYTSEKMYVCTYCLIWAS